MKSKENGETLCEEGENKVKEEGGWMGKLSGSNQDDRNSYSQRAAAKVIRKL